MRKINYLLVSLLLVVSGAFFTSCEEEAAESTFDFAGGEGYISGNKTVEAGATLNFKWTITSNKNMETMDITKNDTYVAGWADYQIPNASKNTFISEVSLTADNNAGVYTYVFTVYDSDGVEIISKSVVITVTAPAAAVTSVTGINMGGSSSSYGSYLDAETGTPYTLTQVNGSTTIKNSVDIIFDAGKLYNSGGVFSSSTGTKFATTTITTTQFAAATTDALFSGLTASSNNITIAANSVVLFQTAGGKKGLIKVNSMASANGDLNIDLKVQQ